MVSLNGKMTHEWRKTGSGADSPWIRRALQRFSSTSSDVSSMDKGQVERETPEIHGGTVGQQMGTSSGLDSGWSLVGLPTGTVVAGVAGQK